MPGSCHLKCRRKSSCSLLAAIARGMVRTPRSLSMQANQSEPQRLSCDKHLLLMLLVIGATLCPGLI